VRWSASAALNLSSSFTLGRAMARFPTKEEVSAYSHTLDAYCKALGKVAHAWNHMQEGLGQLFCDVAGLERSIGMTIWHSLKSDLAQRQMLEAMVAHRAGDDDWAKHHPKAEKAITNLINDINSFSSKRNAAVHAPCNPVLGGDDLEIVAVTFFGNPNAKKLSDAVVLKEQQILDQFEWFERTAETYRRYIRDLVYALSEPRVPWPDKPRMPTFGEKNSPQDRPPDPK
jgi:hypothetical protein